MVRRMWQAICSGSEKHRLLQSLCSRSDETKQTEMGGKNKGTE